MRRLRNAVVMAALVAGGLGCGLPSSVGSEAGATPGGAQDLALARAKVDAGQVPKVEDLPYEGLYSEHDLPLSGARCDEVLCVRAGAAVANDFGAATPSGWVQLGLSSNINLAGFRRAPLNAAIVIDHSGSMGVEKMEAAKAAADKLVELLGEEDRLTVVEFDGTSRVVFGPLPVVDRAEFHRRIAAIKAAGGTCIECGLRDGFSSLALAQDAARANRLFLFTDAQPNVGSTGASDFMDQLTNGADKGLYTTVFGVGLDYGQALSTRITSVAGANAFFLATAADTRKAFDEDFDLLVTPVAFDLEFSFEPSTGMTLSRVYGVPGEEPTRFSRAVKTVFLSRRRGALVAQLAGPVPDQGSLGTARFQYRPAGQAALRAASLDVDRPTAVGAAHKVVALTRMLTGLRLACAQHANRDPAAETTARAAMELIEAEAMVDPDLTTEAAFARALHALF